MRTDDVTTDPRATPPRATASKVTVLAASAVASLMLLAGCSGAADGPGPDQPGEPTEGATTTTPAPTLPKGVTPAPIPTKVANDPADRKNVVLTTCQAASGGWQAAGTATNPGKEAVEYRITVFFTTTAATTIDSARTDVAVKPGETVKWTAKKEFAAPKEMLCVLRGVNAED